MRRIRVTWSINDGQPRGVFTEDLPAGWEDWPEEQRTGYLSDVEGETFFEIASVVAEVVDD